MCIAAAQAAAGEPQLALRFRPHARMPRRDAAGLTRRRIPTSASSNARCGSRCCSQAATSTTCNRFASRSADRDERLAGVRFLAEHAAREHAGQGHQMDERPLSRRNKLGASLGGELPAVVGDVVAHVTPTINADEGRPRNRSPKRKMRYAPQQVVVASGTIDHEHGVFFTLRPSPQGVARRRARADGGVHRASRVARRRGARHLPGDGRAESAVGETAEGMGRGRKRRRALSGRRHRSAAGGRAARARVSSGDSERR